MSEKVVNKANKRKPPKSAEPPLDELSKDELIAKVLRLDKHVQQLKNIIAKHGQDPPKDSKNDRKFDFAKYNTRHIALKFLYFGWDYNGYVVQEDTNKTIETMIFDALVRAKLIESRETSNYHRCGRTDKGVSAFSQVISIDVRSNLIEGPGVIVKENSTVHERGGDKTKEIDYVHVLNSMLPEEIKFIAWAPVGENFSARFDCCARSYKYFFPRANLDIGKMRMAAEKLVGSHDFRNFCKMDIQGGVTVYIRNLKSIKISEVGLDVEGSYDMMCVTVDGNAFLWHQIRCIMAVLLLVGQGKEQLSVIDELLDVEKNPRKPQYALASELPLVLFDCDFEDVDWIYDKLDLVDLVKHGQGLWTKHSIRATMAKQMLTVLEGKLQGLDSENEETCVEKLTFQSDMLLLENKCKVYKPLMERNKSETLEEKMANYAKRRKLDVSDVTSSNNSVNSEAESS